jgi:hypothetical protein
VDTEWDTTDDYVYVKTRTLDRVLLNFGAKSIAMDVFRQGRVVGWIELSASPDEIVLKYRSNGKKIADPIRLEYSPCHYGGTRVWFICPSCKKRRTMLFRGQYFRCRECLGLTYASLHEDKAERPLNRLMRQRWKLGGSGALFDEFPPRPKGMRWENYYQKREEQLQQLRSSLDVWHASMDQKVASVLRKPEKHTKQKPVAAEKVSSVAAPKQAKPATSKPGLSAEDRDLLLKLLNLPAKAETNSPSSS